MGKQDIIQVLTPDHSVEAIFLDEDATVGDLLAALAEDNPLYNSEEWAIVEVAMPRKGETSRCGAYLTFQVRHGAIHANTNPIF